MDWSEIFIFIADYKTIYMTASALSFRSMVLITITNELYTEQVLQQGIQQMRLQLWSKM